MQDKLAKILKLLADLSKQELMLLNQATVSLIKSRQDVEFAEAAISYKKGDIVSFIDSSGIRVHGIVTKKNPKTIQVTTPDNYYVNIPATYLTLEPKPSKKLLEFRKQVVATREEMYEIMFGEMKKDTFH